MGQRVNRRMAFSAVAGRKKGVARGACQDAVFGKSLNGVSCIALSDGAGSRRLSGTGARRTVQIVVNLVLENFDQIFDQVSQGDINAPKTQIVRSIKEELSTDHFARRGDLEEYACTLIFAAAKENRLLLGHLGDGMAFSIENGNGEVASWPENGEFANETFFVTANDAVERLRLSTEVLEAPRSILLASDGAAVSLLKRADSTVAPAVAKLCEWTTSRARKEMNAVLKANLEGMFRDKTTDDCSIAIMADPAAYISLDAAEISQ